MVIIIKPKGKYRLHKAATVTYFIIFKIYLNKVAYLSFTLGLHHFKIL
jgi:hypothetical protein